MNEHSSLEKYTSHTLFEMVAKGLCVRGELETEQTATYWAQVPLTIAGTSFSFYWAAQPGVLRAQVLCCELVLTASNCNSNSNCNWLQLTQTVCGTGLYNCLTFICFLWASHLHRIQPVHITRWYLRPDAPISRLTAWSKVNMLHMQHIYIYREREGERERERQRQTDREREREWEKRGQSN